MVIINKVFKAFKIHIFNILYPFVITCSKKTKYKKKKEMSISNFTKSPQALRVTDISESHVRISSCISPKPTKS